MAERIVINNPMADALNRLIDTGINTSIQALMEEKRYNRAKADREAARDEQRAYEEYQGEQRALANLYMEASVNALSGLGENTPQDIYAKRVNTIDNLITSVKNNKNMDKTFQDLTIGGIAINLKTLEDRRYVTKTFQAKRDKLDGMISELKGLGVADGSFLNNDKSQFSGVMLQHGDNQQAIGLLDNIEKEMKIGMEQHWLRLGSQTARDAEDINDLLNFHDALARYDADKTTGELDVLTTLEQNPINQFVDARVESAVESARGGQVKHAIAALARIPDDKNTYIKQIEVAAAKGDVAAVKQLDKVWIQKARSAIKVVQDSFRKVKTADNKDYFNYWTQMDAAIEPQAVGSTQYRIAENVASTLLVVDESFFYQYPPEVQKALKSYQAQPENRSLAINVMNAVIATPGNKRKVVKAADFPRLEFTGGEDSAQRLLANMINAYEQMRYTANYFGVEVAGTDDDFVMPVVNPRSRSNAQGQKVDQDNNVVTKTQEDIYFP